MVYWMNDEARKSSRRIPFSSILKHLAANPLFWMGMAASYMAGLANFVLIPVALSVLTFLLEAASPTEIDKPPKFLITFFILTVIANYAAYQLNESTFPFQN